MNRRLCRRSASRGSTLSRASNLDDLVLTAFRRASDEDRLDVAEHLLCALETLADIGREGQRRVPSQARLNQAYRVIAHRTERWR